MSTGSLREKAYQFIQRKILSQEYAPGQKLSELSVAEEMGISRTPVRSAIRELEHEGFVEQVPRYGTIVRKTDRRDISELYDMRQALEGFAAQQAAERMGDDEVAELTALCNQMDALIQELHASPDGLNEESLGRFVDADMQFHVAILRSTANRRLMKSVSDSRLLSEWGRYARRPHSAEMMSNTWNQHRKIVDAIQSRNGLEAYKAMSEHMEFSKNLALQIFDRMEADGNVEKLLNWAKPPSLFPADVSETAPVE